MQNPDLLLMNKLRLIMADNWTFLEDQAWSFDKTGDEVSLEPFEIETFLFYRAQLFQLTLPGHEAFEWRARQIDKRQVLDLSNTQPAAACKLSLCVSVSQHETVVKDRSARKLSLSLILAPHSLSRWSSFKDWKLTNLSNHPSSRLTRCHSLSLSLCEYLI